MIRFAGIATFVLALSVVSFARPSVAAGLKLGYVDMQRALRETEEGKRAFGKLKKTYKKYQRQIRKKEKALKKLQDKLKKQALVLTQKAKEEKARELQRKFLEFQQYYMERQKKLQAREGKLMGPIIKRLVRTVQVMAAEGDFTMIFEKTDSRLLFAQPSLDLTNELIRRFNSGKGAK